MRDLSRTMGGSLVLAQFAREPRPGEVKTRLIPALGAGGALALHQSMVRHTARTLLDSGLGPVRLYVSGRRGHPLFREMDSAGLESVHCQQGADLGMRMGSAFEHMLQQFSSAILVGSDAPGIDSAYLAEAAAALTEVDAVLGPALDGGYVLIGLRRFDWRLMRDIEWGTRQVLAQTESALEEMGWTWRCLSPRADIDRPDDLDYLPPQLRPAH